MLKTRSNCSHVCHKSGSSFSFPKKRSPPRLFAPPASNIYKGGLILPQPLPSGNPKGSRTQCKPRPQFPLICYLGAARFMAPKKTLVTGYCNSKMAKRDNTARQWAFEMPKTMKPRFLDSVSRGHMTHSALQ